MCSWRLRCALDAASAAVATIFLSLKKSSIGSAAQCRKRQHQAAGKSIAEDRGRALRGPVPGPQSPVKSIVESAICWKSVWMLAGESEADGRVPLLSICMLLSGWPTGVMAESVCQSSRDGCELTCVCSGLIEARHATLDSGSEKPEFAGVEQQGCPSLIRLVIIRRFSGAVQGTPGAPGAYLCNKGLACELHLAVGIHLGAALLGDRRKLLSGGLWITPPGVLIQAA